MKHYQHIEITLDQNDYLWIQLNVYQRAINSLSAEILDELMSACAQTALHPTAKAVILSSSKPNSFIASYDLDQLQALRHRQAALKLAQQGQELCALLQKLPIPVIALINGATLGAGVEITLACDAIIAYDQPQVSMAHQDLALGLTPTFGGLHPLTTRMGSKAAWDWIVSGRELNASQAFERGLIDHLTQDTQLPELLTRLTSTPKSTLRQKQRQIGNFFSRFKLLHTIPIRQLITHYYPAQHYPASQHLLTNWKSHATKPHNRRNLEAQTFADLVLDAPSVHLVYLKQAEQRLQATLPPAFTELPHVYIVGVGEAGQFLATTLLQQGCKVTLREPNTEQRQQAENALKQRLLMLNPPELLPELLQRLIWVKTQGIINADIVIETIPDQLRAKQELLAELEECTPDSSLLITTSLAYKLNDLIAPMLQPQRVIGLHLFTPYESNNIVEVIHAPNITKSNTIERTLKFVRLMHKLPLILPSQHSFALYRILIIYLFQGMRLQQQGVPISIVDQAARDFGMRYGPLELADHIGLDTCLQLGEIAKQQLGLEIPASLRNMVTNSKLGKKNQNGFYRYRNDRILKAERENWTGNMEQMRRKLVKQMVEESRICLELGVIEDASLLDMSVIAACGFPAFLGGPIRYATHPLGEPSR